MRIQVQHKIVLNNVQMNALFEVTLTLNIQNILRKLCKQKLFLGLPRIFEQESALKPVVLRSVYISLKYSSFSDPSSLNEPY